MNDVIIYAITGAMALVLGLIAGRLIFGKSVNQKELAQIEADEIITIARKDSELILEKARITEEALKKERMLETREDFLQQKSELEQERRNKVGKLQEQEMRMKNRERQIAQELEKVKHKEAETETVRENLNQQLNLVSFKKEELEKTYDQHVKKLEAVAQLSAEDAKAQLVETLKDEARNKASSYVKDIMDEAKLKATKESKKIILQTIQRTAAEQTIENTVSIFGLDSDDQKGQIILPCFQHPFLFQCFFCYTGFF